MRRSLLLRFTYRWPRERPGLPHLPHALDLQLARVAQWFHATSDTTRLAILEFLSQRDRALRGETLDLMLAFMRTVLPGAHVGTCPLSCCQAGLPYQENLIR